MMLLMWSPDGPLQQPAFVRSRGAIELLGLVALAGGVCAIATGIGNAARRSGWLLVVNGLACSALGTMVLLGASRPVAFRTIAILIVVMAVSIGAYELLIARTSHGHADEWLLAGAGLVSAAFAGVFLGFVLGWIRLEPSPSAQTFHWLGSYFAFSAICMLGLALGYLRPRGSIQRMGTDALPTN